MITVPSPCVSLCQMDASTSLCTGCWRTIDEIVAWSAMDNADKLQVRALIEQRRIEVIFQPATKTP